MELEALAGEVLEEELAAAEAHLVAGGRDRAAAPVLAVALELQERAGMRVGVSRPRSASASTESIT